jgi:hypothetical protein
MLDGVAFASFVFWRAGPRLAFAYWAGGAAVAFAGCAAFTRGRNEELQARQRTRDRPKARAL